MVEFRPLAIEQIAKRGSIKEADVRRLEHLVYRNGKVGRAEAEMLFALQDVARVQHPAWADFFIGAICAHIVNDAEPAGYVNRDNCDWLMRWITCDGRIATRVELDLAVTVLERARWAPVGLAVFALDQVRLAVVHGNGPLRAGPMPVAPGTITPEDAGIAQRILGAFGREAGLPLTRAEADALFDIDCCSEREPAAEWTRLLVSALAHGLLAGGGRGVLARGEAFASEKGKSLVRDLTREERALARLERQRLEIVTSEEFQDCTATWLAGRMGNFIDLSPRELDLFAQLTELHPEVEGVLREQGVEFVDDVVAA